MRKRQTEPSLVDDFPVAAPVTPSAARPDPRLQLNRTDIATALQSVHEWGGQRRSNAGDATGPARRAER